MVLGGRRRQFGCVAVVEVSDPLVGIGGQRAQGDPAEIIAQLGVREKTFLVVQRRGIVIERPYVADPTGRIRCAGNRTVSIAAGLVVDPFEMSSRLETAGVPQHREPPGLLVQPAGLVVQGADIDIVAVALVEIAGGADRQRVGQRDVDGALQRNMVEIAITALQVAFDPVGAGRGGVDEYRPTGRIRADQRALRPAQYFDVADVVEARGGQHRRLKHAVDVDRDPVRDRRVAVCDADTADIDGLGQS